LIFLDESCAKTNLTRLRGRAPRGQRVQAACPYGHWQTTTLIGALRLDGSTACMSIEGATDTPVFDAYVRQVLLPTLRAGDIVVMDNLSPHKNEPSLELLAQAEVKVKAALRSAEARTAAELFTAIGQALRSITPQDALNWFASCGYSII